MIKGIAKRIARGSGLYLASNSRLGVELEIDLARLTAHAPLATIFDVGANFGQTARRFAAAFPSARIHSFEPVPTSYERLAVAVKSLPNVTAHQIALGEAPGTAKINIQQHDAGSNSINPVGNAIGTVDVEVATVDQIADDNNIGVIDLLKIDVEGYELSVLSGAARRLNAGQVRFVYAECVLSPNAEMPHTSFFELHKLLDSAGFCFVTYYAESFHLRLGCAMGNVLYALRKSLPIEAPGAVRNIV